MPSSTILSDNGVSSGTSGIKTSGGNDGLLLLQTTTAGGTATTAVTVDTSQNVGVGASSPSQRLEVSNSSTNTAFGTTGNQLLIRNSGSTANAFARIDFAGSSNNPNASILAQFTNYATGATNISFGNINTGTGVIVERARIGTSGQLSTTIDGTTSVLADYGCRTWVNFNGTGTVAIRGSGNVSSLTDNSVGNYSVNMTNAMTDANYSICGTVGRGAGFTAPRIIGVGNTNPTASVAQVSVVDDAGNLQDCEYTMVAIIR